MLGAAKAKSLLKAYILTGNDCLSKIGTKHAAFYFNSGEYLTQYGEKTSTDQDISLAETYLVRVWAGVNVKTTSQTFDQIRLQNYLDGVKLDAWAPTSSAIRGHLQRGAFLNTLYDKPPHS